MTIKMMTRFLPEITVYFTDNTYFGFVVLVIHLAIFEYIPMNSNCFYDEFFVVKALTISIFPLFIFIKKKNACKYFYLPRNLLMLL